MSATPAADAPRITTAYVFTNGMVIVFDQHGQQMPEYQGPYECVAGKIGRDAPDIRIEGPMVYDPPRPVT